MEIGSNLLISLLSYTANFMKIKIESTPQPSSYEMVIMAITFLDKR